ncbi:hypothetical protein IFO70_36600 [Phormidium tenue FACHB-886]|nr:hypothetical protein [Phormidium tenue FACHB-886]
MGELKFPQQEEFRNIAKAEPVAEATQQHLKHDISRHLNEVEGGAFEDTILAAKHRITQVRLALQASSESRAAMRTSHKGLVGQEMEGSSQSIK